MTEQSCLVKATIMLLPGVGRHPYLVSLCPSKWPCQWGRIPIGCQSQITLVQCRGAKSLAYDLYTGQGVVSSRAVSLYYYPLIGCFVIQGSRNTYIIELIIITIFLSKLKRLYTVCRSKIYIGIYKYQYYWYDLPKIF
uniref:Uncharacterized protein n=1 Tax=Heterorhabditis bacteriophora TaxID=37862 RepID=A0A1I7WKR8_HETBA